MIRYLAPAHSRIGNRSSVFPKRSGGIGAALLGGVVLASMAAAQQVGLNDFSISGASGPPGDPRFDAGHEAVAYNASTDEYLVVWDANTEVAAPGPNGFGGKREVFARRLDGVGAPIDVTPFRIATAGPAADPMWNAQNAEVVYVPETGGYFAVWEQTVAVGAAAAKDEIVGVRLGGNGRPVGSAVRISFTGPDANLRRDASEPALVLNSADGELLVAWESEEVDLGSRAESEIYCQRVDAATGQLVGAAVRVSRMGPDGDTRFDAQDPGLAYNSTRNEYLVVWRGDTQRGALVDGEFEVFGQLLNAQAQAIGADDFRISSMGPDGDVRFRAEDAAAAFDPVRNRYLVTWTGNDTGAAEEEVYAKLLSAAGQTVRDDFRISSMGPDGNPAWDVNETVPRYDAAADEFLVLWLGEDDRGALAVDEREVFGQRLDAGSGDEVGADDFRVSDLGPDGDARFDALTVDLAYDPTRDEFLAVFSGDDDRPPSVVGEVEVYGQRLSPTSGCVEDEVALCLNDFRFRVTVEWTTTDGRHGAGQAEPLTGDTGTFWFFDPANKELVVKVLDARAINDAFWVFYGALSDVEYTLSVTDTATGAFRTYVNPAGTFASAGDTAAFPQGDGTMRPRTPPSASVSASAAVAPSACAADDTALCLASQRFRVEVSFVANGSPGQGRAAGLTPDTGTFWFFDPANVELMVKVLDARVINGHFWVFYGALSDVEYTITVTDTSSGTTRTYHNPSGTFASAGDTEAF